VDLELVTASPRLSALDRFHFAVEERIAALLVQAGEGGGLEVGN
jgi:hypothetical protein